MAKNKNKKMTDNRNQPISFKPTDYSDVGQGAVLARVFKDCLCYCEGIGWLTYKDGVWVPSDIAAQGYSQKLTDLQLQEAARYGCDNIRQEQPLAINNDKYIEYALSRRSSARISATLREAMPKLKIETAELDADPTLLNTPSGEIDLKTGELMPHDPAHYITHITRVSSSNEGEEIWQKFLTQISCENEEVKEFLQQFAGMAAIGKVYEERLVIAVGSGGNGKSTFFNALQDVLGDYAGTIRSELMIASNDSGKKFEYARLRGKRFIIAEELEEGKQLDTAAVKHLCSTGDINAQYKGKDIFTFKPSHSTVLCTNHMPTVKTIDHGTWDRLLVIPFEGRFRNEASEIKNYGTYLVEHCGGYILQWIIEGAQKYIQNNYKLVIPEKIANAIKEYQEENDWASEFFEEKLVFDSTLYASGSELYEAYESYCLNHAIQKQSQNIILPKIAEHPGVTKKRTSKGMRYYGVCVRVCESIRLLQEMTKEKERSAMQCTPEESVIYDLDLFCG